MGLFLLIPYRGGDSSGGATFFLFSFSATFSFWVILPIIVSLYKSPLQVDDKKYTELVASGIEDCAFLLLFVAAYL